MLILLYISTKKNILTFTAFCAIIIIGIDMRLPRSRVVSCTFLFIIPIVPDVHSERSECREKRWYNVYQFCKTICKHKAIQFPCKRKLCPSVYNAILAPYRAHLWIRWITIWSLVPLPFLNVAWRSGGSWFMYYWSLAWRILSLTWLVCEMSATVW